MTEYERRILERLGKALPDMAETKKAWLLGLVEGIAGEPGRMEGLASMQTHSQRPAAGA